jgi:tripartite-type tricarboxylate transporter receptor subunit TctC
MRSLLIAGIFAAASISSIQAQVYPSNPITMIVPLPAGSAFDVTARLLAEHLRVSLGQPVIVENATGASGSVGTGRCARAAPDGYTLCFGGVGTHVLNGAVLALPYDVLKDFEPVSLIATTTVIARLNAAIVEALADPTVRSRLADLGQEGFPREQQTPETLGAWQKTEIEKWWPIVKAANIKAE